MRDQLPLPVGLDDHARFTTYFAGPNEAAVAHLRGFVRGESPACWIWGAPGSGKTHLLQAVCAAADERGSGAAYIPLSPAAALRHEMLDGWPNLALACIDDLQAVVGDLEWERALFRLFNQLGERGGAMLVAADAGPAQLPFALPDLRSRLSWGAVFRLSELSDSERLEALRLRAGHRGLELGDDVGEWLLRRMPRDLPTLYRLLDTLDHASLAAQRRLTIPFVRKILQDRQQLP